MLIVAAVAVVIAVFATWLVLFLNRGETSSASRSISVSDEADGFAFIDEAIVTTTSGE
ncbi:hypothetical protein H4N58_11735 [Mumia sp. ZJ1417]|uniref:hypothetical protein n=1 Tax=Mumia sp. ZJ1417 TaxID=2708082 RepID=UPI00142254B3|nr:hypothetical protein [Mumia sp. ZJ1417]QMW64910.1 hypothetical protein H4N58_11735 [Mumia sp. ZJ1417]